MIVTSGAFDGLHSGHVAYLRAAKALAEPGELLVCCVAPDNYLVQTHGRTARWTQAQRVAVVEALDCVDLAIGQGADDVAEEIRRLRPRLVVKGTDWAPSLTPDSTLVRACAAVGALLVLVHTPGRHNRDVEWRL